LRMIGTSIAEIFRRCLHARALRAGAAAVMLCAAKVAIAAPPNATVVEYYSSGTDHYFMTASPNEQALLDTGTFTGWARTGVTFLAWNDAAHASASAHPVCRYYGRPEAGLDSHFYSAFVDDCDAVQAKFAYAWQLESPNVFYIEVPDRVSGVCKPGTDPIYRAYDNRTDANHRYMVSLSTRAMMQARGWIPEGYGPVGVVMCTPSFATDADDIALVDGATYSPQPGASLAQGVEAAAVTHHALTLRGTTIHYTATTGHLVAKDPQTGQPLASFFYVAYTADGQDPQTRPVTFFYNGGPGSATVWLHLGSFGPKRLVTGEPATSAPQPFPLVDNLDSLIDTTDMVFVDAVGSGLSEAVAPYTNMSFFGVDSDASVFRNFIQRYVEANGRAGSPKYLFGESYGTTRSAVLAYLLETAGIHLAGVILQSSVLNYGSNCGVVVAAIGCAGYLPSYGSVGAYYGLLNPNPTDLTGFRSQVEGYTSNTYSAAVVNFLATGNLPDASVLQMLANSTGAPVTLWQRNFNLDPTTYQFSLIPGTLIGRYDARVSVPTASPLARDGDPSSTFISASFASAIDGYLRGQLKYSFAAAYIALSNAINYWDFTHDQLELPDTIPDLAAALVLNPQMVIVSLNGYHDLATPYFQTILDLARLANPASVRIKLYDGGHMTYLDDVSRQAEKSDLAAIYRAAAKVIMTSTKMRQ
jgi:carboxypeptidase C (cathepsin A)